MEVDVIHDYQSYPDEEVANSVEAVKNTEGKRYVDTVWEEKNVGTEKLYLGLVVYEDDS